MDIRWVQAVLDLPAEHFDATADFWVEVTGSGRGPVHPDHDEFLHLVPPSGDMHLELQRVDDGPARAHLDLLVDEIAPATEQAVAAGATLVEQRGYSVLRTPGGVPFCIVPHSGEAERAPVIDAQRPHAVDQICLDIPYEHFDDDVAFWAELTGWPVNPARMEEFRSFDQPSHLPLRMLLQRLGADDTGGARAHLDISSGEHVASLVADHEARGADVDGRFEFWTALCDPAGMPYCLTSRAPRGL